MRWVVLYGVYVVCCVVWCVCCVCSVVLIPYPWVLSDDNDFFSFFPLSLSASHIYLKISITLSPSTCAANAAAAWSTEPTILS